MKNENYKNKYVFKNTLNKEEYLKSINCYYFLRCLKNKIFIKRNEKTLVDNNLLNNIIQQKTNNYYFNKIMNNIDLKDRIKIDCYSGCTIEIGVYRDTDFGMDKDEDFYFLHITGGSFKDYVYDEDCKFIPPEFLKKHIYSIFIYNDHFHIKCVSAQFVIKLLRYNGAFYNDIEKEYIQSNLKDKYSKENKKRRI